MTTCLICHRELTDPESRRVRMGPECHAKAGDVMRVIEDVVRLELERGFEKREDVKHGA
jgi:hypothetical protein